MNYLLASASMGLPQRPGSSTIESRNFGEVFLILGSLALVIGIVVVWAVFIRKPRKARPGEKVLEPAEGDSSSNKSGHRRKKFKKRRRDHRPRNPTLAETGGLPPPKPEGQDLS